MKRNVIIQGLKTFCALSLFAGAVGCSDDGVGEGNNVGVGNISGGGYIALNVVADGGIGTRAWNDDPAVPGDFDAGTEEEQVMARVKGAHWIIFFNEDNSFHSMQQLDYDDFAYSDVTEHNTAEKKIAGFVGKVAVEEEGQALPTKFLVVLNARPTRMDLMQSEIQSGNWMLPNGQFAKDAAEFVLSLFTRTLTQEEIEQTGESVVFYTYDKKDYCTMSNTTYLDFDGQAGGPVHTLETITEGAIKPTVEAAKNEPVTVHVERLAVKVELQNQGNPMDFSGNLPKIAPDADATLNTKEDDETSAVNPQPWSVLVRGWGVNGRAKRTYLFKNLNDARGDADNAMGITPHYVVNGNLINPPFFANWNDRTRFRSYWAVDGHYQEPSIYPTQYRDAKDGKAPESRPFENLYGNSEEDSPLHYYSYEDIVQISQGKMPHNGEQALWGNLQSDPRYRYCAENTLGEKLLKGTTYQAASTHVLIAAQLLLGDEVGQSYTQTDVDTRVSDKYYAGGYWWDFAGYMQFAYNTLHRALTGGTRTFPDIFNPDYDAATGLPTVTTPAKVRIWAVKEGSADVELGGEYMKDIATDGITEEEEKGIPFRLDSAKIVHGDGKVMLELKEGWSLRLDDIDEQEPDETVTIDSIAFKSMVVKFTDPADYYKNGKMYYYEPIRHVQTKREPGEAWELGDIGIVRNHWYTLNIKSVLKPGIPVADPEQPIVPNTDPEDQYLGVDIHIVPWHVIEQDVVLGD